MGPDLLQRGHRHRGALRGHPEVHLGLAHHQRSENFGLVASSTACAEALLPRRCFWGADSQGKQVFLTGLLDSYVAVYDLASPLLASCPITAGQPLPVIPADVLRQLLELVDSEQVAGILDAGYPDAEIVAARERNLQVLVAQCQTDRLAFQLAGYPM